MGKFIKQLLWFALLFFVADKLLYIPVYLAADRELDKRLDYVIKGQMNKDCIILGSSRGARDVIAYQLEKETKISTYNLSYPGSDVEFHEFILRTLLKFNKAPKWLLLVVDEPDELLPANNITFRLERLYPLSKYNYINKELSQREHKNRLLDLFVLNHVTKTHFDFKEKHFHDLDTLLPCGSMPISFQEKNRKWIYNRNTNNYPIEKEVPVKLAAFQKIQKMCDQNNIQLIIVFPPNFETHNLKFQNRLREISNPKNYFFTNDTTQKQVYQNKSFYFDESHLKENGAQVFTDEISQLLLKIKSLKKQ